MRILLSLLFLLLPVLVWSAGNVVVTDSAEEFIVGNPNNNGAFWDGTRYWVFYNESAVVKAQYGTDLSSMSQTGGNLVTSTNTFGKSFAVLFGKDSGTWYAWGLFNRSDIFTGEAFVAKRWELGSGGLGVAASSTPTITDKEKGRALLAHNYGSEVVTNLYGTIQSNDSTPANSTSANRRTSADMGTDTGAKGWNPVNLNYAEYIRMFKLSDGYLLFAIDQGDGGSNTVGAYEQTKTNIGDNWGGESAELGFTKQKYATNTSHAGQQGIIQLDDGIVYVAYVDDAKADGDSGLIILKNRGNQKASTWATSTADVIGSSGEAWHIALATDGTDVWVFYVKDSAGSRDTSIYYKKYDVSETSFGDETKLADMQGAHTFNRMFTQWRAANEKIIVAWSELSGGTYDLVVEEVDISVATTAPRNRGYIISYVDWKEIMGL